MPRTRTQRIVFSILMAFAMVYGMELYNQALLAGGLRTELFAAPPADIVPLMATVIVLETLVGGRVAARLVGRLLDAERCPQVLVTILRGAFTCWTMCPMMSLVATLAFKQPPAGELVATWLQTVALNFPMALLWQLFVAGPAVGGAGRAGGWGTGRQGEPREAGGAARAPTGRTGTHPSPPPPRGATPASWGRRFVVDTRKTRRPASVLGSSNHERQGGRHEAAHHV